MIRIGIDPGVNTGYAEWDGIARRLIVVDTVRIHEAMRRVHRAHSEGELHSVTFEDARMRKYFGPADARQARSGAGIREGVGSVKRDCSIWEDYLTELGVTFVVRAPAKGSTKWPAALFERTTGWKARTSEHARDAAMLVFAT